MFGSETCSTVQSRGIYHFPLTNRLLTFDDQQCSSLGNCTTNWGAKNSEHAITAHRDRDFCFGQYVWSGFDYLGEPTPYFTKNSYFGQVDTAGFKKDSFYMFQSAWTDYREHPMVHILPYWDFNEGQLIDIRIFSNAPSVELLYQGESQGVVPIDHAHGTVLSGDWQIPYGKGTITALAYDENGAVIARDEQRSFGDPAFIRLTPDKTALNADGEDLIFLTINTLDENNIPVANGRSRMHVSVSGAGRLIGLDNGDSTDYEQYKGTSRKLFGGKLLAIIAAKTEPGEIHVHVSSPSLPDASLTLDAIPAQPRNGISCFMENTPSMLSEEKANEIPVRKIELTNHGTNRLDKETASTTITAKIYPENATYDEITFKAITLNGVESNAAKIDWDPGTKTATVTAAGDGEFRLCACCNNGSDHAEVISELEFEVTGLGAASYDPYRLVPAIDYTSSSDDGLILSFQGGVYITGNTRTTITFEQIDFGDYGADEIHLPIFSFSDELPLEVWQGIPKWQGIPDASDGSGAEAVVPASPGTKSADGECLLQQTYRAKSWYNHYQENVFTLSKRLKGIQTITIVVYPEIKMSLQGFYFTKIEKAYARLLASDSTTVTGDMFTRDGDAIRGIGNNVTIEYKDLHFSEQGFGAITICGRSHIEMNTIHVRFIPADGTGETINQVIDVPYSEETMTLRFPLQPVSGDYDLNLIFLPGCKFDLEWLQFE